MDDREVDLIARAFYDLQDCARDWDREPELLKERFRQEARTALQVLDMPRSELIANEVTPLVMKGDLREAREFFMNSRQACLMPRSTFRTVLRGASHTFDVANGEYLQLVGPRDLLNMPLREALPELAGQGYYELLDDVFQTKRPFVGSMLPIRLQSKPGAAVEEHLIDLIYRPIEDPSGRVLGLFVEGFDRTAWARS